MGFDQVTDALETFAAPQQKEPNPLVKEGIRYTWTQDAVAPAPMSNTTAFDDSGNVCASHTGPTPRKENPLSEDFTVREATRNERLAERLKIEDGRIGDWKGAPATLANVEAMDRDIAILRAKAPYSDELAMLESIRARQAAQLANKPSNG